MFPLSVVPSAGILKNLTFETAFKRASFHSWAINSTNTEQALSFLDPVPKFTHVVVCSVFSFSRIHFLTVSTVIPRLLFKGSLSFVLVESLSVVSVMLLFLADIISGHVNN